ncbi:fluoride efflux transporter CrcB [Nonlabens sp. SY33080]|uniref:fluoride efflux transporter CrcB n=1 Tax=Nonlabens sp. SY33080 TaxID=2719911 RepID=UPI001428920B|nr:fluoride efflux transporter CrcB [Nonlabens sp. SY33080]
MKSFFLVFIGGGIGSYLRYAVSIYMNSGTIKWLPTLIVNVLGCFLLGILWQLTERTDGISHPRYLLFGIGFCGGLTTFSTFSLELVKFIKNGDFLNAGLYFFGSMILGMIMLYLGYSIFKSFI